MLQNQGDQTILVDLEDDSKKANFSKDRYVGEGKALKLGIEALQNKF